MVEHSPQIVVSEKKATTYFNIPYRKQILTHSSRAGHLRPVVVVVGMNEYLEAIVVNIIATKMQYIVVAENVDRSCRLTIT